MKKWLRRIRGAIKMAEQRGLFDASADVTEVGLTGDGAQELLGGGG